LTQYKIENACREHLASNFTLGKQSRISSGAIDHNFGDLANTDMACHLLQNDSQFPKPCDPPIADFLQECAKLLELAMVPLASDDITLEDFMSFWLTAKESTSSCKSGRHFAPIRSSVWTPK
jgi:hypothetical protein